MKAFDAVIVGAGPAGSATAIALARKGFDVALVDKHKFPRQKLCGDFVNPINWPLLRELEVDERILGEPHERITGFRITSASGESAETSFSRLETSRSYGLGLARARLDDVLLQRARQAGATIRTGTRLAFIRKNMGSWELYVEPDENWRARVLVGADGRNSWVARQLGLRPRGAMQGRSVGFQARLRCAEAIGGQIAIHLFPGGYAGVVALGDGTLTLAMAVDRKRLGGGHSIEFLFDKILGQNPYLKEILESHQQSATPRSVYPVYFPARHSVGDGALLVGDAARVSEPVTGEGIYFAMRSGLLAAESIDRALRRGNLTAAGLAAYERACRHAFRRRLAFNALLRFAIYRPALLDPIIRLASSNDRVLHSLVDAVCIP